MKTNKGNKERNQESRMNEEDANRRERTSWEKIGLVEYNERTEKWECRIDDCQEEMNTARKIAHHRRKHHSEQYYGPDLQ